MYAFALVHRVGCKRRSSARQPPFGLGTLLAGLYALTGGISLVGAVGHHHPAEVLGRGAVFGGVDALLDGYDAGVAPGEVRLDPHALPKWRPNRAMF